MQKILTIFLLVIVLSSCTNKYNFLGRKIAGKNDFHHVHLMHIDGVRPDVFQAMLDNGQLPHYSFLISRGKFSSKATTIDKSETMKVIPSYLSSRIDTKIVGWWQFERDTLKFRNFWLDPKEVINYAVGLEFPQYPTIYDFLSEKNENIVAGFTLHRRGVPFNDYTRAYSEGLGGVFSHKYYDQAHGTMTKFRDRLKEFAKAKDSKLPVFTHSLLATPDEFGHLVGVGINSGIKNVKNGEYCFKRKYKKNEVETDNIELLFKEIDNNFEGDSRNIIYSGKTFVNNSIVKGKKLGHFTKIRYTNLKADNKKTAIEFCIKLPKIAMYADEPSSKENSIGESKEYFINPYYALGIILMDIETGHLINTLRSISYNCEQGMGHCFRTANANGIERYIEGNPSKKTLFEDSTIMVISDHGMVDSKNKMAKCGDNKCRKYGRQNLDFQMSFIEYLNKELKLDTPDKDKKIVSSNIYGIDDSFLPLNISTPHLIKSWQTGDDNDGKIAELTQEANLWANRTFNKINGIIKDALSQKYFWLFFLKKTLVYPKVDKELEAYKDTAIKMLMKLYLDGNSTYQAEQLKYLKLIYNKHIKLVYGGGARNNAEIFIPHQLENGNYDWQLRPDFDEIISYKPNLETDTTLLDVLKKTVAVGLIFIRENNPLFNNPYGKMKIHVMDRFDNHGIISVQRDKKTNELIFGYFISKYGDPLGYNELSKEKWHYGTYDEWQNRSVEFDHYYPNAVGGMGSFLYSKNSAIGDITLMHTQGWNFGDNSGGHGGLHKGEKRVLMIVSGNNIKNGELMAEGKFKASIDSDGSVKVINEKYPVYPSLLDVAPTALNILGYGDMALTRFSRTTNFKDYLTNWKNKQEKDIITNFTKIEDLDTLINSLGLGNVDVKALAPELKTMLKFMKTQSIETPNYYISHEDGNQLLLD